MGPVARPRVNGLQLEIRHIEITDNRFFAAIPRVQNNAINTRGFVGCDRNNVTAGRVRFRKLFRGHSGFTLDGRAMGPNRAALNQPTAESGAIVRYVEIPAGLGRQVIERFDPRTGNGVGQCTYGAIATVPFETAFVGPTRVRVLNPEMRPGLVILLKFFRVHHKTFGFKFPGIGPVRFRTRGRIRTGTPLRYNILSVARLPFRHTGICWAFVPSRPYLPGFENVALSGCCAAPIRTGNTSAKNLGVTVTPRRKLF